MISPFAPFGKPLLDAFIHAGCRYFIRQSFPRGKRPLEEGIKGCFIITHYADIAHAQHHLLAIREDPHAFLYEWDNAAHQYKLLTAADRPPGFKIYSSVFRRDWEKLFRRGLTEKARAFIEARVGWAP